MAYDPEFSVRIIIEERESPSAPVSCTVDKQREFSDYAPAAVPASARLGPSDTLTLATTGAALVSIESQDFTFKLRVAAGEEQLTLRQFLIGSEGGTSAAINSDIVLEGNGADTTTVRIVVLKAG